jgi:hypothetical protein
MTRGAVSRGGCPTMAWVPSQRAVLVAVWTPVLALALSVTWSGIAGLVLSGESKRIERLTFWAGDLPLVLFGVPAAGVWLWTSVHSAWKRQGWQVLILAAYYGAAFILALLGMVVVAGLPVGDL